MPGEEAKVQLHVGVHGGCTHQYTLSVITVKWYIATAAGNKISNIQRLASYQWEYQWYIPLVTCDFILFTSCHCLLECLGIVSIVEHIQAGLRVLSAEPGLTVL